MTCFISIQFYDLQVQKDIKNKDQSSKFNDFMPIQIIKKKEKTKKIIQDWLTLF